MKKESKSSTTDEKNIEISKPKMKTVTLISINPIEPNMWKYAEEETKNFYKILKDSEEPTFTHIFTNLKVDVNNVQIEV